MILSSPAIKPKRSCFFEVTGTTFATGVPRFVMRTGSPVALTSSITDKQRADLGASWRGGGCQGPHEGEYSNSERRGRERQSRVGMALSLVRLLVPPPVLFQLCVFGFGSGLKDERGRALESLSYHCGLVERVSRRTTASDSTWERTIRMDLPSGE
jgi:hypothetical protein